MENNKKYSDELLLEFVPGQVEKGPPGTGGSYQSKEEIIRQKMQVQDGVGKYKNLTDAEFRIAFKEAEDQLDKVTKDYIFEIQGVKTGLSDAKKWYIGHNSGMRTPCLLIHEPELRLQ